MPHNHAAKRLRISLTCRGALEARPCQKDDGVVDGSLRRCFGGAADYPYGLRLRLCQRLRARLFLHGAKPACDVAYGEEQGVVSQKLDLAGCDFRFKERPILAYAAAADDYRPTFA